MEEFKINEVRDEISEIRNNMLNSGFERDTTEKIDTSLNKIIKLLDPRPPASEHNFCPTCGNKLSSDFDNLDLEIKPLKGLDSDSLEM